MLIGSLLSWERGLKFTAPGRLEKQQSVAPLVGAWIEILVSFGLEYPPPSLLSWERGLKLKNQYAYLKYEHVAPLVGAWIEISQGVYFFNFGLVSRSSRGSVD